MIEKLKSNPVVIVLLVVLIALGAYLYFKGGFKLPGDTVSLNQKIAEKALSYINQNVLSQGNTASLVDIVDQGDVLKIRLKIGEAEYVSYATKDGKLLFPEGYELDKATGTEEETATTIGSFSVNENEVCKEEGKPVLYFFGSAGCPHCVWEKPIVEKVAKSFENYVSFHNNIDSEADEDVFYQYSNGSIPTLVLGCKYSRVGSGEKDGEEQETKNLTALLCKLTGNQPGDVCGSVQDLVNQVQ